MRFEWNSLREGDPVSFHGDGQEVIDGLVALIDVRPGSNAIGIESEDAAGHRHVDWPNRLNVHPAPNGGAERCLRCEGLDHGRADARPVATGTRT